MEIIEKNYNEDDDGFDGYILGYLSNPHHENNLENYLKEEFVSEHTINLINGIDDEVLVIKNIYIDEEYRGNGHGSEILEEIMSHSLSGKIILTADIDEEQLEGFNLLDFYKSYGFLNIDNESENIIVSEELKQAMASKLKRKMKF